jgi:hypothetical protein
MPDTTTRTAHPLAQMGLRCTSCAEPILCDDDCICPACWLTTQERNYRDEAIADWLRYAAVMQALNAEGIEWLWGTNFHGKNAPTHDIEIEHADKFSITIARRGDVYTADLHGEVKPRTHDGPAEWDCITGMNTQSIPHLVAWVADAIANTKEA